MLKFLKKTLQNQQNRLDAINRNGGNAQTEEEVRALAAERTALEAEIAETRAAIAAEEQRSAKPATPAAPATRDFDPLGSYGAVSRTPGASGAENRGDIFATREYEEAFRNFYVRGERIPDNFRVTRADGTTMITDVSAVIPTHYMDAISEKLNGIGKIWARCRHTSIPANVQVPIAEVSPEATWVGEGSSSDKKHSAKEKIVFEAFGLECKISQSLLADALTLDSFKTTFVEVATKAVLKAAEIAVFNGDGENQFTGIIKEKRIPAENIIELTLEELKDWESWQTKFFAKVEDEYADGSFYMSRGTYFGCINSMTDKQGQPIARVTVGLSGKAEFNFGGNEVVTVGKSILPDALTADEGDIIGVFGDLAQYGINAPMPLRADEWEDKDQNVKKRRVILGADGHVLDHRAFYLIKLAAAAAAAADGEGADA